MAKRKPAGLPAIPANADPATKKYLQTLANTIERWTGSRGDALDSVVTYRDLIDGGLASGARIVNGQPIITVNRFGEPEEDNPGLPPAKPLGFKAVGTFQGIQLLWDAPQGYSSTSYTQVWRSEDADLENAVLIGGSGGRQYYDIITGPDDLTFFYWVRHSNDAGTVGAWSDSAEATKLGDVGYLVDKLQGSINESTLAEALKGRIDLIDGDMEGSINARISQEATERVQGDEAIASQVTQVSASLGDKVASVEQSLTSTADALTGKLNSLYTLRVDNNGRVSGFGLGDDGETSTFIINADRFAVGGVIGDSQAEVSYPLVVDNDTGKVVIDGAQIKEASIQSASIGAVTFGKVTEADGTPVTTAGGLLRADKIDVDSLSVGSAARFSGDVFSDDFVSGTRGWCILQNGYTEFNNATIRGNLEIRTLTVNGNSPYGAVRTEGSDRYSGSGNATFNASNLNEFRGLRPTTATRIGPWKYDYINEMPKNGRVSLTAYAKYSVGARIGLGYTYRTDRSDGNSETIEVPGNVRIRLRVRVQVQVDNTTVIDRTWTVYDQSRRGVLSFDIASSHYGASYSDFADYKFPAYRSRATVRSRLVFYFDVLSADEASLYGAGNLAYRSCELTLGSGIMASGDLSRLG